MFRTLHTLMIATLLSGLAVAALPWSAAAACPAYLAPVQNHNYACFYSNTSHPLMHNGWATVKWDYRYQNGPNLKRGIETFQFSGYPQDNLKADWASPDLLSGGVCQWEYTLPLDGIQCTDTRVQSNGIITFAGCNDGHSRVCFY